MEGKGLLAEKIRSSKKRKSSKVNRRLIIYLLGFLFFLSLSPSVYINSSFLEQFVGNQNVGYVYTAGSVLMLCSFILIKHALRKFGNYKIFLVSLSLTFLSFVILSLDLFFERTLFLSILFVSVFIVSFVTQSLAVFNLDIFLENSTINKDTGGIRGIFLTGVNLAFIIGPLIAGLLILEIEEAGRVYLLGAVILLPIIWLAYKYLGDFRDAEYTKSKIWEALQAVRKNKDIYKIFKSNFLLNLFYSWMIIYTPIFLHEIIGFPLGTVATIIGFGLVPFIFLQAPLGRLADTLFGEKEMLTIGFIITAISTIAFSFSTGHHSVIFWIMLLFITRIGASIIEIMSETYLFKKINDSDIDVMSLYRALRPFAYILGPMTASILLIFIETSQLFIFFGIIVLFGIKYSLTLKDTL